MTELDDRTGGLEALLRAELAAVADDLDPGGAPVAEVLGSGRQLRHRRRRVRVAAGALALAACTVLAVAVFPGQRAAVRPVPTTGVTGVRVLSATEAAQLLQQIAVPGEPGEAVKAWVWDDRGGSNVLMLTEDVASRHPGGVARWGSLHAWVVRGRGTPAQEDRGVTHVSLDQTDMPGGCPKGSDGVLGFVEPPQVVRDVDGDGYAEVFMGSFTYCTASPPARVRLDVEPGRPSSRSSLNVDGDGVPKALPAAVAALGLLPEAGADVEPVIPHTSGRLWPGSLEQVSRDVFLEMFR